MENDKKIDMEKWHENVKRDMDKYNRLVAKVVRKCDTTKKIAEKAIEIACDFNISTEEEMIEECMTITHTIHVLQDDYDLGEYNLKV